MLEDNIQAEVILYSSICSVDALSKILYQILCINKYSVSCPITQQITVANNCTNEATSLCTFDQIFAPLFCDTVFP
jgi:hypothetical protein